MTASGRQVTTISARPPCFHRDRMLVSAAASVSPLPSKRRWTHQASRTAIEKSTRRMFRLVRRSLLMPGMR